MIECSVYEHTILKTNVTEINDMISTPVAKSSPNVMSCIPFDLAGTAESGNHVDGSV